MTREELLTNHVWFPNETTKEEMEAKIRQRYARHVVTFEHEVIYDGFGRVYDSAGWGKRFSRVDGALGVGVWGALKND